MEEITFYLSLISIVCLGTFVQSSIGFGFGLFCIPLLVWTGLNLNEAIVVVMTCSFIQALSGVRFLKHDIPWQVLKYSAPLTIFTMFFGVALLNYLGNLDVEAIRAFVGSMLLILILIQLGFKVKPREKIHPGWGVLAFSLAGFIAGVCGMGSPTLVIWLMAHDWATNKVKGFLFGTFILFIPGQLLVFTYTFGYKLVLKWMLVGVLLSPVILGLSKWGLRLSQKLPVRQMRLVVYIVLSAIGVRMIVSVFLN